MESTKPGRTETWTSTSMGAFEDAVISALQGVGYAIEVDWRPNRLELTAPGRGWVDVHPLVVQPDGSARQAALRGGWHGWPIVLHVGRLEDVVVPCVSIEAQTLASLWV